MAGIAGIRAAARTVLAGVSGMNEALAYPPNGIGTVPVAWLGEAKAKVTMGQAEKWLWQVPVAIAYARKGDYGQELLAGEAMLELVLTAIRANVSLGGLVNLWNVLEVTEGVISVGGVDHTGVVLACQFTEQRNSSYSG